MKYISDYQALNIPDEKGLIADWHSYKFNPNNIKLRENIPNLEELNKIIGKIKVDSFLSDEERKEERVKRYVQ